MAIDITYKEAFLLDSIDNETSEYGKSDTKCPRCGNDIVIEYEGKSYTIRCKTDGCISMDYRGI